MAVAFADTLLSAVHIALHPTLLQIHTHLLTICQRGHHETWPVQRTRTRRMENTQMQPVGRKRI